MVIPFLSIDINQMVPYRESFTDGCGLLLLARHSDFECEQTIKVFHGIFIIRVLHAGPRLEFMFPNDSPSIFI